MELKSEESEDVSGFSEVVVAAMKKLFLCPNVVKIAFGFGADYARLQEKWSGFEGFPSLQEISHSVVDLREPFVGQEWRERGLVNEQNNDTELTARFLVPSLYKQWLCSQAIKRGVSMHFESQKKQKQRKKGPEEDEEQKAQGTQEREWVLSCGLNRLSFVVFGQTIDKSMQCSNWDVRPLTLQQVLYAALDARVLISLYRSAIHAQSEMRAHFD